MATPIEGLNVEGWSKRACVTQQNSERRDAASPRHDSLGHPREGLPAVIRRLCGVRMSM